jgi:hypothetical protein
MLIINFTGKISKVDNIDTLKTGVKFQRIIFKIEYSDPRIKTDYYGVYVYGEKSILEFWKGYNDKEQPFSATIEAKLNGRISNDRNTLTLTYKKIKWNYQ